MVVSNVKKGRATDSPKDELRLVDAVLAAFCFQSENHKLHQPLNVQAVYKAFAELRQQHLTWLQDLQFTYGPADAVPISGTLEDILFDLGASGIMAVENPWYKYLKIKPSKLKLIKEKITRRRSESEQEELRRLADGFLDQYSKIAEKR